MGVGILVAFNHRGATSLLEQQTSETLGESSQPGSAGAGTSGKKEQKRPTGNALRVFNVLREHLQLLAVVGAFQ